MPKTININSIYTIPTPHDATVELLEVNYNIKYQYGYIQPFLVTMLLSELTDFMVTIQDLDCEDTISFRAIDKTNIQLIISD